MLSRIAAVAMCCGAALAVGTSLAQELMANGFIAAFLAFAVGDKSAFAYVNGWTLYTPEKDEPGKSNCAAACTVAWPPSLLRQNATLSPPYVAAEAEARAARRGVWQ